MNNSDIWGHWNLFILCSGTHSPNFCSLLSGSPSENLVVTPLVSFTLNLFIYLFFAFTYKDKHLYFLFLAFSIPTMFFSSKHLNDE